MSTAQAQVPYQNDQWQDRDRDREDRQEREEVHRFIDERRAQFERAEAVGRDAVANWMTAWNASMRVTMITFELMRQTLDLQRSLWDELATTTMESMQASLRSRPEEDRARAA
jgi:hypothetical protein